MPDAARSVTQAAVESFARSYLESFGASIDARTDRWHVKLPTDHPLSTDDRTFTIGLGNQLGENESDARLTPESKLFHELVDTAMAAQPLGSATLTRETAPVDLPTWLVSDPDTTEYTFYPLYDREALCFLFRVSVETVSEYQTEFLRAVAIDLQTGDPNPEIATGLLDHLETVVDTDETGPRPPELNDEQVEQALDTAQQAVEAEVRPELEELQQKASEAAAEEIAQYQQLQQQELQNIHERLQQIDDELSKASHEIEAASSQGERVEALSRRQELTDEQVVLEDERDRIQTELNTGFPDKRSDILDRHAVRVSISPVAVTAVTYERGELELIDSAASGSISKTIAFAPGIGPLERVSCDRCEQPITDTNPVHQIGNQFVGDCCVGGPDSTDS
ncbi:hypothetical protein NDI76_19485 [Halogeometricum sp. S1BR25-6]|uniref:Uncharacterized protein n=1 Tax=Halogeometricum salsisoli TaxID=2950536 RepID=A0ABU2GJD2_9EURY|nr:hypothetical protein [Halogeometricum sp. S1BR25-6]MDS0300933.1 hypothetical protein [Halogeometricum sp. S1BR25-6]